MTADIQDDSAQEMPVDSELADMTRKELASEIMQLRKQVVRLAEEVVKSEMGSWQVQSQQERMEFLVKESRAYTEMLESQSRDLRSRLSELESIKEALAKAEQAMRDRQAKFDRLQHLSHIGSLEWDLRSDKISRSRELLDLLGIDEEAEVITADPVQSMLVHPEDMAMFESNIQRLISLRQPVSFNYRAVRPDGDIRQLWLSAEVMLDELGDPAIVFSIVKDITPKKIV
jgi:PAS domain S-box-containing protein